jgi:hypothetical protein
MLRRSPWDVIAPYGYGEASQSAGTVVAPLLAGFTITLIGLVVDTSASDIRYRNLALLVLTVAAALLIAAVQCAYSARQYLVRPDEITAWWPGFDALEPKEYTSGLALDRRVEQLAHSMLHRRWAARLRFAYNAGVVLVLAGLAIVLVPSGTVSTARLAAIAVAALAAVTELVWVAATIGVKRGGVVGRVSGWIIPSYSRAEQAARDAVGKLDAEIAGIQAEAESASAEPDAPPKA